MIVWFQTTELSAQCPGGQVFVTIDVTTDAWGYECFWDLTPSGNGCGNGALFTFGNVAQVGCAGAGQQTASGGGYANNTTTTETLGCMNTGGCYDINYVDDWGDGGASFTVFINGIAEHVFGGTGTGNVFSFCITTPAVNDANMVSAPLEYTRIPLSQVGNIVNDGTIASMGSGNVSGATMTVNVMQGATTVYSETTAPQNINSGASSLFSVAGYTPTSIGTYQVQYTSQITESDEDLSNNVYSYTVEVTDTVYARDNGIKLGKLGIGAGELGYLGNAFNIVNTTKLSSASVLISNDDGTLTGTTFYVDVFATDAMGTPIGSSIGTGSGTVGATADQWYTVSYPTPVNLAPGEYVIALREETTVQQQIGTCASIITPGTSWVSWQSQPWANTESFGPVFEVTFMIRANVNIHASIEELDETALTIYPNPSSFEVIIPDLEIGSMIEVYDNVGQMVLATVAATTNTKVQIEDLKNGIYTIRSVNGSSVRTARFVKN
jgi:hypothetical protein